MRNLSLQVETFHEHMNMNTHFSSFKAQEQYLGGAGSR